MSSDQSYGIFESKNLILRAIIKNTIILQEGHNYDNIEHFINMLIRDLENIIYTFKLNKESKSDIYINKLRKEINDIARYQTIRSIGDKRDAKYLVQYDNNLKQLKKLTKPILNSIHNGNFDKNLYLTVNSVEQKKIITKILNIINATIIDIVNQPNINKFKHQVNIEIIYKIL